MKRNAMIYMLALLLLSSCQVKPSDTEVSTPSSATSGATSSLAPIGVSPPTGELFGRTDVDEVLYNGVVGACARPDLPQYVCLPNIELVGTYQDDAGNDCYVCQVHSFYYELSGGSSDPEVIRDIIVLSEEELRQTYLASI